MDSLANLANLIEQRNTIEREISRIIGCPAHSGHIAEFIAASIFEIDLMPSANHKHYDGRFLPGSLENQTVNIKYRSLHMGALNMGTSGVVRNHPDWYLVLAGPTTKPGPSKHTTTPWTIAQAYLFNSQELLLRLGGKRTGIGTGLPKHLWQAAMLYPEAKSPHLTLGTTQRSMLALFQSEHTDTP